MNTALIALLAIIIVCLVGVGQVRAAPRSDCLFEPRALCSLIQRIRSLEEARASRYAASARRLFAKEAKQRRKIEAAMKATSKVVRIPHEVIGRRSGSV